MIGGTRGRAAGARGWGWRVPITLLHCRILGAVLWTQKRLPLPTAQGLGWAVFLTLGGAETRRLPLPWDGPFLGHWARGW